MTASHARRVALLALAAAGVQACAGAPAAAPAPAPAPPQSASASPVGGGEEAAIAQARADSARHPYTAADIRFMTTMIGHHAQAITMARMAPTHGASPSILTLAGRIINAQQDEIATMQRWLRDRRLPVPAAAEHAMMSEQDMAKMAGHEGHDMGAASGELMPGMLTPEQMKQLDAARGAEFDRLFLTFMIQHHKGATEMVKQLFGSYGAGQDETVFKFASDVNVDQTTEIQRMQKMLVALTLGIQAP